ncbi:MAG: hypothetical protein FJX77_05380 [Armatimonadetes bacterium]|nr:hypothetical protein [Armatimonadota bacterium]
MRRDPASPRNRTEEAAAAGDWPRLADALGELCARGGPESASLAAQGLWLALQVPVSLGSELNCAGRLHQEVESGSELALLIAAHVSLTALARCSAGQRQEVLFLTLGLCAECAAARSIPPEAWREWLHRQNLDRPTEVRRRLLEELERHSAGEPWCFERSRFLTQPPAGGSEE